MRIRLTFDVTSPRGAALAREMEASLDNFEYHCSCPDGRTCEVVVQEGVGHPWYDVIVIRPGYAPPPDESWFVVRRQTDSRYIGSFLNPSPEHLVSAVSKLIAAPLVELG